MAKRFTDTDKWRKPFFRALQGPYKALWLYILDDCDIAGIWIVDFEVAKIRTQEDSLSEQGAISAYGDHIEVFDKGRRWYIRDFTDFQYGELKETNRMHVAVSKILQQNKIGASKGLVSPQGQGQGISKGQGHEQGHANGAKKTVSIGESTGYYFLVGMDNPNDNTYKVVGPKGMTEFFDMNKSIVNLPNNVEKFLRRYNGKQYDDFKHVWNDYNKFLEKA